MVNVLTSLEMGQLIGNLIIVTGSFVVLLVLIRIFAWQNIVEVFAKRSQKISDEICNAEKANKEAQELLIQRKEELDSVRKIADQMLIEAKSTGESIKKRILVDAENQVQLMKSKAQEDIAKQKAAAFKNMKEEVSEISLGLAKEILMKELDRVDHSQLIDRYLDKMEE